MKKVEPYTERIFVQAVSLHTSGRVRTSIHADGREVFLLNMDKTLLLKFETRRDEFSFPVNFEIADYDSPIFYEEDGDIVFLQEGEELERRKYCRKPMLGFEEVQDMYQRFQFKNYRNHLIFADSIQEFLNESLSHLEISARDGKPVVIQRDIYSGARIEVKVRKEIETQLIGSLHMAGKIQSDFGPVGLRTNDFLALFTFNKRLIMKFPLKSKRGYCLLESEGSMPFQGILTYCAYDELGELEEIDYGRKEPEKGGSQQEAGSEADGTVWEGKMQRRSKSP